MSSHQVRNLDKRFNLWGGFRDELVATAMTLSLLVLGSYILTERMLYQPKAALEPAAASSPQSSQLPQSQTLGAQDTLPMVLPTPELSKPSNASVGAIVFSEVPYGQNGDYDYSGYAISFRDPKVVFDSGTNTKHKLTVSVWLKNKNITEGLFTRLTASIVKDGKVIVPSAALYVPQSKQLAVGEEYSFTASLSLIEGTDVRELKYDPGNGTVIASHFLYP